MVYIKSINGDALVVVDCQQDLAAQGTPNALEGVPECVAKVGPVISCAGLTYPSREIVSMAIKLSAKVIYSQPRTSACPLAGEQRR